MQYTSLPLFLLYALLSLLPALPAVPLIAHNAAYSRLPYFPGSEARHGLTDHDNNGDGRQRGELTSSHGSDIVLRCDFSTDFEADALLNASKYLEADVWGSRKNWIDIRLPSSRKSQLYSTIPQALAKRCTTLMTEHGLSLAITESYPSIQDTVTFSPTFASSSVHGLNAFFHDYQPLSVIVPWMRLLSSLFSSHVRMITIGTSYEGRDIYALRVGVHPTNKKHKHKPRKTILIPGGSHAREWISTSTVTYVANHLITSYGRSRVVTELLEQFDWVFVPTLNPDGYAYTWEHDRLWRKNRQSRNDSHCVGLDPDRSYGFQWDGTSSFNPCSETYAGTQPFEGVEAKAFADWARNETDNNNVEFVGLLDLHSYSQQVLYPYSYSCHSRPPSLENLQELGFGLAKAMRSHHGSPYEAVSACEGNAFAGRRNDTDGSSVRQGHAGGGSALDWFYHELRVTYTYQIKLRDTGSYGFLLPKQNIVPTGKETVNAVMYFGRFLLGEVGVLQDEVDNDNSVAYPHPLGHMDDGDPYVDLKK